MDLNHYYCENFFTLFRHLAQGNFNLQLFHWCLGNPHLQKDFLFDGSDITVFPQFPIFNNTCKHRHDFFKLIYVYQGTCLITMEDMSHVLKEGDLFLMNLNVSHTICTCDETDVIFNICLKPSLLTNAYFQRIAHNDFISMFFKNSLQHKQQQFNCILFQRETESSPHENLIQHIIYEHYEGGLYQNTMLDFLVISLLIELARKFRQQYNMEGLQETIHSGSEIIQYIVDNYSEINMGLLARHFNYSSNYLSIIIKRYSGSNFSDILQNVRFKKAIQLLNETNLSISEIVELVGYTNRTWFVKKFAERYNTLPSQYRKVHQKKSV